MSGALCEIWTHDGEMVIGFTQYRGSSDTISPRVCKTGLDAMTGKTTGGWDELAACDHDDPCEAWAYSHYGGGDHWPVTVCNKCWVITGRLSPYIEDYGRGADSRDEDEAWEAEGWPKKGPPPGVTDMDER